MPGSNACLVALAGLLIGALAVLWQSPDAHALQPAMQGRPVQEALDEFRDMGLPLVYSTSLVTGDLLVLEEPVQPDPLEQAMEILLPHGLTLAEMNGAYFVIRLDAEADSAEASALLSGLQPDIGIGPLELEDLTVTASRYVLFSNSQFFIDQRAIRALPDLGEDPVRSAQKLPGAAASGLSSKSHFRGGEHNETAIYLNGLELLDPFHIRDYHSIFSSIDARAISGVEAYTGGFPATYGDQMSGVLLLDTMKPEKPLHTELGLSVYNTSVLNTGFSSGGKVDWLISARDSNLDVILNEDLGKPDYFDVFAELGINFSDNFRLSLNALYSDDQVVVITESDPEELEQSTSDTLSENFWLTLDNQWTANLSSSTTFSYSGLENLREADANDPEKMRAAVYDDRRAKIFGFRQDWIYSGISGHTLRAGVGFRKEEAHYRYRSRARYLGFYQFYPGVENPTESNIKADPKGHSYSLFLSDRWQVGDKTGLELGLRWDRQTYTGPGTGSQTSPRISLLHSVDSATDLRFTWGRYYQSQAIQELQVEDGLDHFFAPQRADHWIAGIQHRFSNGYRLRAEAYLKNYDILKPRFENLFDPLVLIPELAPDRVRLDPESARAKGVEFTLENPGTEDLNWWVTYVWSRATDRIQGKQERRSWDQRHAVQAGIAWQRGYWEIGLAANVHTGWPTTGLDFVELPGEGEDAGEDVYLPIPGPRNAEQLALFAQLDFRVSREFPVRIGRLSAFFEVTNLTNRKNECCTDYDIDENDQGNAYLDAVIDYWLPIIPAVGIFWEF